MDLAYNGRRVALSVPDGNPPSSAQSPASPVGTDWVSKILDCSQQEDEKPLCRLLEESRAAGHPKFSAWILLTTFESLAAAGRDESWRRKRTHLLLEYFDSRQRLKTLHGAIDHIKAEAEGETSFSLPEQNEDLSFVFRQIIQVEPELAFESSSGKQSAFMFIAAQGAVSLVKFVLATLRELSDKLFPLSVEDRKEYLFNKLKVPDRAANTPLGLAVEEGHADIVKVLLEADKRLAGREYLSDDHIKAAVRKCKIDIMKMVRDARPKLAQELPGLIVQYGETRYKDMWTEMAPWFEEFLHDSDILHLAVKRGKVDVIDWLVARFQVMVTRKDKDGKIALSYNTELVTKEKIRALIVPHIVRLCTPMEMKELLRNAKESPRQASLDLRVFNRATHNFTGLTEVIKADTRTPSGLDMPSAPIINFESVLRYVHFPDLSQKTLSEDSRIERQESFWILSWLRQKGVKSILKLVVPDCRTNPLNEERISKCLEHFEVEELNWRRLDLGIEPIVSLAPTLAVLHLYSSGNWAVLCHWVSKEGLERLEKLKELNIVIVEDFMTPPQADQCVRRTFEKIENLKSRSGGVWNPRVSIKKLKWSHGMELTRKVDGTISSADAEEKSASSCINVDTFVSGYTDIQQRRLESSAANSNLKPLRKIKIALIDTGIGALEDRSRLPQLPIKPGISFNHGPDEESESPWWIPSSEHGPHMADIITSIDPYCELYPIKITNDMEEGSLKARPIIEAIRWATDQRVDIISLSLVLFNNDEDLYDAVSAANKEDIIIICSTADKGNNQQKVYPAQYLQEEKTDCLIPIAGCDRYGKLTDWSTETEAKYHFLGKDVTARSEGLLTNASKEISGSSVATAIAAGTASLVLACCLYASEKENYSRKQQIEKFFRKMQTEHNRRHGLKYVEPAIIFGEKSNAGKTWEAYIKDTFGRGG